MYQDFKNMKHDYLLKTNIEYRRTKMSNYSDKFIKHKKYVFNKMWKMYETDVIRIQLNNNFCLFKEIWNGNDVIILKIEEFEVKNIWEHNYEFKNGECRTQEINYKYTVQFIKNNIINEESKYKSYKCKKQKWTLDYTFKTCEKLLKDLISQYNFEENNSFNILNLCLDNNFKDD